MHEAWYDPGLTEFLHTSGVISWDNPHGTLKELVEDEEWDPKVLNALYRFQDMLYVKMFGRVIPARVMMDYDWFVHPRQRPVWELIRGRDRKMGIVPQITKELMIREYLVVELRGPTVQHVEIMRSDIARPGFSIVIGSTEYICRMGKVSVSQDVDTRLKLLIHERFAKVLSKDYLEESYYEENRAYAAWSRDKHKDQANWLKRNADHLRWIAPGDGNGLILETMSNAISTDIHPVCPGVKNGNIESALKSLEHSLELATKEPGVGLVLSYISSFITQSQWERIGRLTCPVVIMDVRPIIKGRIVNILGYGITSSELTFTPLSNRSDTQMYGGQFSENLLCQADLEIVELNSAVFYVARMKPLYEFFVQDASLITALKGTTIVHRIGAGVPIVMTLESAITSERPVYYVQIGRVTQDPELIEFHYEMSLDTRTLYFLNTEELIPKHPSIRVCGKYFAAVAPVKISFHTNTEKEKTFRQLQFGDDLRRYSFTYGIEKNAGIVVYSPYFARHVSLADLLCHVMNYDDARAHELLSLIGMSILEIDLLYTGDSKRRQTTAIALVKRYSENFYRVVFAGTPISYVMAKVHQLPDAVLTKSNVAHSHDPIDKHKGESQAKIKSTNAKASYNKKKKKNEDKG